MSGGQSGSKVRFGLITRVALLVIGIEIAAFSSLGWFYIERFSAVAEDNITSRVHLLEQMIARSELPISAVSIQSLISNLVGAPYLDGMIIGGNGRVIVSLNPAYLGRPATEIPELKSEWLSARFADEKGLLGKDRLTFISHLRGATGDSPTYHLVLVISTTELTAQKRLIALQGWGISFLFILLSSVGLILVARQMITRRVDISLTMLRQVEEGNLEARIPVTSEDELGQLQRGINSVTAKVSALLQQHRQSEKEIATILDAITDGVIAVDGDGHILRCNPSATLFLGNGPEALVGGSIVSLLPEVSSQIGESWWMAPESLTAHGRLHFNRLEPNGITRDVELGHGPIKDLDGGLIGAVLVLQDVTERKQAEIRLKEAVEYLTVTNGELERFAYVASHDLQEPLRTIVSFTQLLELHLEGKLSSEDQENFAFVIGAAKRMRLLISDLLSYSRINFKAIKFSEVSLAKACDSALKNLAESISESGAEIIAENLPEVRGDQVQMMQLFQNLIGNAIKYRRPDVLPRVVISAKRNPDYWIISVKDNGIGIEETDQDIFEIFRRLHPEKTLSGTGVGLAICKRIIQRHRGEIWFDSREGIGTAFHFSLPCDPDHQSDLPALT